MLCLCRGGDRDRAPRFRQALDALGVEGAMGDLDDGPQQQPLEPSLVESAIMRQLPSARFDLIISHSPAGEYTRHRRHEEAGRAVTALWRRGDLSSDDLWHFAYEDGARTYFPRAIKTGTFHYKIPPPIWERKYAIVTTIYGFDPDGWEAKTTPKTEAFWPFSKSDTGGGANLPDIACDYLPGVER